MAALLDRHAQQEAESVAQLDFLPASDEESTAPQRGEWWKLTGRTISYLRPRQRPLGRVGPRPRTAIAQKTAIRFTPGRRLGSDGDGLYVDSPLHLADPESAPDNESQSAMAAENSQDLDSEVRLTDGGAGLGEAVRLKLSGKQVSVSIRGLVCMEVLHSHTTRSRRAKRARPLEVLASCKASVALPPTRPTETQPRCNP